MSDSLFIALLKDLKNIFVSWQVDESEWERIRVESSCGEDAPSLFIEIFSVEEMVERKIDEIAVFDRVNNWHLFINDEYYGQRIFLRLSYDTTSGSRRIIGESEPIDVPMKYPPNGSQISVKPQGELFEISGMENLNDDSSGGIPSR
jgi:hypothetical protein